MATMTRKQKVQGHKNSHIFAVFYDRSPAFLPKPGGSLVRMRPGVTEFLPLAKRAARGGLRFT